MTNVSHDLRTPLTSIQGFSQALIDGAVRGPDAAAQAGRIIYDESERMRTMVEDLLELSRIESGQINLAMAGLGQVHMDGSVVPMGTNGWRMNSPTELELTGLACSFFRNEPATAIDFSFPCEAFLP